MGKKKIKIQKIDEDRIRQVTKIFIFLGNILQKKERIA
jgi:hypothetical protein